MRGPLAEIEIGDNPDGFEHKGDQRMRGVIELQRSENPIAQTRRRSTSCQKENPATHAQAWRASTHYGASGWGRRRGRVAVITRLICYASVGFRV